MIDRFSVDESDKVPADLYQGGNLPGKCDAPTTATQLKLKRTERQRTWEISTTPKVFIYLLASAVQGRAA